jgi:hypothetical protein
MAVGYPLTVAGAAVDLALKPCAARHSLLPPFTGHLFREDFVA